MDFIHLKAETLSTASCEFPLSISFNNGIDTLPLGVTLIKTLPRPWFGAAQSKLFPKYFTVVLLGSMVMLMVNVFHQSDYTQWPTAQKAEVRE